MGPLVNFAQATVDNCKTIAGGVDSVCDTGLPKITADQSLVQKALSEFLFPTLAAIALFFIIQSGLKMITAQGEPQSISKARKSIIYAAMGLAIALSGEAIVVWLLGRL